MDISAYTVKSGMTILQTMSVIDKNARRIAFYVEEDNKLKGVVTDGDVRRYILNGGDLNQPVEEIVNYDVIKIYKSQDAEYDKIMISHQITALPIVNEDNILARIEFLYGGNKVMKKQVLSNIPVVIMAGGKGTRLQPYTNILPKPLIPIGEETITERIMDNFREYGIKRFYMIVNYKKNLIRAYFEEKNIKPEFIEEQEFLGTGGGLRLLEKRLESTFFLTNCDILLEADLAKIYEYHKKSKSVITMVCAKKKETLAYGSVILDEKGSVVSIEEKPSREYNVNTGVYVMESEVLKMIPENTFIHITDIISILIKEKKKVGCYIVDEDKWLDMGQFDELYNMKKALNIN